MSEWEPCVGETDEWFTPPEIFDGLGCLFDLDPCAPSYGGCVPAMQFYTKMDNGMGLSWWGFVWMNPPFGARNGVVPWLAKFFEHGNGIALVPARTSAGWFHDWAPRADALLFPRGKTKFVRPDGTIGKSPGTGIVLMAAGERASRVLRHSSLGLTLTTPTTPDLFSGAA